MSALLKFPAESIGRLPRGRHGLPREAVAVSQQARILAAMSGGPKALARRDAALRQFTGLIETGRA